MPSRRTVIAAVLAVIPLCLVVLNLQAVHQAPQTQQRIQPHEENFIQKTLEAIRGEERRSGEEIAQAAQDLTNAEAIVERLERAGNELANLFAEREASETSRDAAEAVAETERQRINPDAPWEREVKELTVCAHVDTFSRVPGHKLCGNQIYVAFVLNSRVDLHAIDATPARWRGGFGSSPLNGASAATPSPRKDLVKNYRVPNSLIELCTGPTHY